MGHSLAAGTLPALGYGLFLSWIPFLVVFKTLIEPSSRVLAREAQPCVWWPVVAGEFPSCMLPLAPSVVFPCRPCSQHTHMMTLRCLWAILKPMWVKSPADLNPRSSGIRLGLSCLGSIFWSSLRALIATFSFINPSSRP